MKARTIAAKGTAVGLIACLVVQCGCTTMKLPPYPSGGIAKYRAQTGGGGIELSTEPMLDRDDVKKYGSIAEFVGIIA